MTQPRQPQRTPPGAPGRSAATPPGRSVAAPGAAVRVQPGITPGQAPTNGVPSFAVSSAAGNAVPMLREARERILIAADTTGGKTFAYLRLADKLYRAALQLNTKPAKFYMIDTFDAAPKHLGPGQEFEHLLYTNGGNVYPFTADDWYATRNIIKTVNNSHSPYFAKRGDYICYDLANHIYDQARDAWLARPTTDYPNGRNIADLTAMGKGFSGVAPNEWNIIGAMYADAIHDSMLHSQANLIFTAHLTDMVDVEGRERKDHMLLFDDIGKKPRGAPQFPTVIDTIVMLWAYRMVDRDDRGHRTSKGGKTVRHVTMVKDKGMPVFMDTTFDMDLFDVLPKMRLEIKRKGAQNVTDPAEVARIEAQIKEALEQQRKDAETARANGQAMLDSVSAGLEEDLG